MKENNLQKKPRDAREYANLFLLDENGKKRDFSNSKSVCLITIGYAETTRILLEEFAGKDITIIDRKSEIDFIEAWIKLHKRNDIRVKRIEVETDEELHSTILKLNMNMFDLIIANPPYKASTHAKIAKFLMDKKCAKEYAFLCPTSLLTGYSANCVSVRENYKVDEFEYIGPVDFGGIKPDVSIYYFGFGEEKKDWKTLQLGMKPTIEKGIAEKCAKVECLHYDWFKENLVSRAAQDLKKKPKDLTNEEIRQWQIGKMQEGESFICNSVYSNSKADGIILKSQMIYASSWYGPKELIPKLKNDLYKGLAVMFSTNKRDQQARTLSQLPVDLESCGFTEEEKEYLLKLSRGSKEHD